MSREAIIGNLPTNSGIIPKDTRSSCLISEKGFRVFSMDFILPPNPTSPLPIRDEIISSNPANDPPQINKIFEVLIGIKLCSGCFRPPLVAHLRQFLPEFSIKLVEHLHHLHL